MRHRHAEEPSRCSVAEKVIAGNNDNVAVAAAATTTVLAVVVVAVDAVFIDIGRGEEAEEKGGKKRRSATGGTINSYAKHVRANDRRDGTRLYAFSTFSIRYTEYSAANRSGRERVRL